MLILYNHDKFQFVLLKFCLSFGVLNPCGGGGVAVEENFLKMRIRFTFPNKCFCLENKKLHHTNLLTMQTAKGSGKDVKLSWKLVMGANLIMHNNNVGVVWKSTKGRWEWQWSKVISQLPPGYGGLLPPRAKLWGTITSTELGDQRRQLQSVLYCCCIHG